MLCKWLYCVNKELSLSVCLVFQSASPLLAVKGLSHLLAEQLG